MAGAIVIIGGGIAGLSAAEAARNASPATSITLICQEEDLPYYRLNLTRYLAGEIKASDLPVHPESWYSEQRITILSGAEVTTIDRSAKSVSFANGAPRCPGNTGRMIRLAAAASAQPGGWRASRERS
jgi:nitrite reductase (NADH) large subunit